MKSSIYDPIEIQTTLSPDELVTSLDAMAGDPYPTYPMTFRLTTDGFDVGSRATGSGCTSCIMGRSR